jgi:multisubunit Na+/H+ antiporter MnhG subunit
MYLPFYAFAATTLFGALALIASISTLWVPDLRGLASRALSWGGVPAAILPILVYFYVRIHLTYFGPIRDDLGLLFYLIVTPFTGFGLGSAALAVREVRHRSRSSDV